MEDWWYSAPILLAAAWHDEGSLGDRDVSLQDGCTCLLHRIRACVSSPLIRQTRIFPLHSRGTKSTQGLCVCVQIPLCLKREESGSHFSTRTALSAPPSTAYKKCVASYPREEEEAGQFHTTTATRKRKKKQSFLDRSELRQDCRCFPKSHQPVLSCECSVRPSQRLPHGWSSQRKMLKRFGCAPDHLHLRRHCRHRHPSSPHHRTHQWMCLAPILTSRPFFSAQSGTSKKVSSAPPHAHPPRPIRSTQLTVRALQPTNALLIVFVIGRDVLLNSTLTRPIWQCHAPRCPRWPAQIECHAHEDQHLPCSLQTSLIVVLDMKATVLCLLPDSAPRFVDLWICLRSCFGGLLL